ncbi:AbiTii domain-containing protein [Pseudanabaena mucicola]|uniref:AbiTii domain-containing protein n=1 Tax=Pseudanabaena mucicola FACHB-723 TaxID=2692860 RepID=A0ABR8A2I3_9CYAN|nr:hypothetical protein [Pseudanabaena mucicola]MBD2189552.1 hypothetical protein [Pseudanabaena mucicola FACHB-723]
MSPSEPSVAPSFTDIITALNLHLELEDAIEKLPLTHALEKGLAFAKMQNLNALETYISQELNGYGSQPPNYRYVNLSYFDDGGQAINGLKQYSSYPVVTGVKKLEMHLKNGLTLMLPKQILGFLSQVSGRQVDSGHIAPSEISQLLETIRSQVIIKFTAAV